MKYHEACMKPQRAERQRAKKRQRTPKRLAGETYNKKTYRQAIKRACLRAGVPVFHPNQIRHMFATKIRQRFGLEAAQVLLGHTKADVTQVYAERNESLACDVARQIG